jgi:hypothetical protein
MGGSGSGWQGPKRDVVEDCLVLSIDDLMREGALVPGAFRRGLWRWTRNGAPDASVCFESDLRNKASAWVQLQFTAEHGTVDRYTWLTRTSPHFGGTRWWFRCPILNIRVAKLYLPPGARLFASRRAHGLTYRSCQQSGMFDRLARRVARARDEARHHR